MKAQYSEKEERIEISNGNWELAMLSEVAERQDVLVVLYQNVFTLRASGRKNWLWHGAVNIYSTVLFIWAKDFCRHFLDTTSV